MRKNVKRSASLSGLAIGYALSAAQQGQLAALLAKLEADPQAPTAARERGRALDVHGADSLVATELEEVRSASVLADLGSGAGMPGAVLAIALPDCHVRLVESQERKCGFLRALLDAAGIANATVVCARAEEWPAGVGAHDVVCARALAPQPVVLEYAAPLLRVGGTLVDWRGERRVAEERSATLAAEQLGLELASVRRVEPYPEARDLHLHVFVKAKPTPERFPRRVGVARKRPLGG